MSNIVTFQEIDFTDGHQIRIEHEYLDNIQASRITMIRTSIAKNGQMQPTKIDFYLEDDQLQQFCNFFKHLSEVSNGNK